MKPFQQLWDILASVKLAIFTLFALSITAIIGTVIPQGEQASFYADKYGPKMAQFFQILDIPEMYGSWWFLALLTLLVANLVVCSIERFPTAWRLATSDNLALPAERVAKLSGSRNWPLTPQQAENIDPAAILAGSGWPAESRREGGELRAFSQRGRWSRLGVYIVHTSILVIFVGAAVGDIWGVKGSVMLPEQVTADKIFASKTREPIDLGFSLRCDSFVVEFYDNGMPKTYRSRVTIIEEGKEVLTSDIEVNRPLIYRGFTFYQSSYRGYQDFILLIQGEGDSTGGVFTLPFQKQELWQEKGLQFGVVNAEAVGQRVVRAKLWFKAGEAPAVIEWFDDNQPRLLEAGGKQYRINVKQMYATGLQVAKDPGVWIVYLGCGLMLIGLAMAFFMAHHRVWLYRSEEGGKTLLVLAGNSNKNRPALAKKLTSLEEAIDKTLRG